MNSHLLSVTLDELTLAVNYLDELALSVSHSHLLSVTLDELTLTVSHP